MLTHLYLSFAIGKTIAYLAMLFAFIIDAIVTIFSFENASITRQ